MRNGVKMGNTEFVDTTIHDGLTDAFNKIHMGITGGCNHLICNSVSVGSPNHYNL